VRLSKPVLFVLGVVLSVAVAWALVALVRDMGAGPGGRPAVVTTGTAEIGGPFTLTDHTGKRVTDKDFHGRFALVFFGFTYCPDVCPTELQTIARALDLLGEDAAKVTPVFITVDPARDDPETMARYVRAFHPRMVGLTGSPEEIAAAAKAYKVYYRAGKPSAPGANDYLVDHTSFIYLMGPDGAFRALYRAGTGPEALAAGIRAQIGAE